MATKQEVLDYIAKLGEHDFISRDELVDAFERGSKHDTALAKKATIPSILYYIGCGVIFLGIMIFTSQNWYTITLVTKLLVGFGTGIAAFAEGIILSKRKSTEVIAPAFYMVSALVTPIGLFAIFDGAGFDIGSELIQGLIALIMTALMLTAFKVLNKNIFVLFGIIFGSWLFFELAGLVAETSIYHDDWKYAAYRFLAMGAAYLLLGYAFSRNKLAPLKGFLYGFGSFIFLSAGLALGQWQPNQNIFWELVYPVLIFGALFASVYLKNRSLLVWGSVFLMLYILKTTAEYFTESLGWSLSLVIAGLAMVGVGYLAVKIKQKFIKT